MKYELLSLIEENPYVNMLDIAQSMDGFDGNLEWCFNFNTVIWDRCTLKAVEAMISLINNHEIIAMKESKSISFQDDGNPHYPIATSATRWYQRSRWLPIIFVTPKQLERDHLNGVHLVDLTGSGYREQTRSIPFIPIYPYKGRKCNK
jgi:hypothetical protein